MKLIKVALLVAIVSFSGRGKQYFAPGWSATRSPAVGCQYVQIAGQAVASSLIVEIQDSSTGNWLYIDDVPGDHFATPQNINLGACVLFVNLYIYPKPYQYLIFAQWLQVPLQLFKPRQPTG